MKILNNSIFAEYKFPSFSGASIQNTLQSTLHSRDKKVAFIALGIILCIAAAAMMWYFSKNKKLEATDKVSEPAVQTPAILKANGREKESVIGEQQQTPLNNVLNDSDDFKSISKGDQKVESGLSDPQEEDDSFRGQVDESEPPIVEQETSNTQQITNNGEDDSQGAGIEIVKDRPYSAQTNDKHGDKGAVYTGEWKNDRPHGKGKMVYPNAVYEGDFKEGEQTGHGKLMKANPGLPKDDPKRYEDCEYYEGGFEKGVRQGYGRVYRPRQNGGMPPGTFIGQYKDGRSDGFGMWKSSTGDVYIGEYQRNKPHGCGLSFNSEKMDAVKLADYNVPGYFHPIVNGLVDRINNVLERKAKILAKDSVADKLKVEFDLALFQDLSKQFGEAEDKQAFYTSILALDFAEALSKSEHMDNLKKIVHLFEYCFLYKTFSPVINKYMDIYDTGVEKLV